MCPRLLLRRLVPAAVCALALGVGLAAPARAAVLLSSGYVMPSSGDPATRFTWRVKYWSTDNLAPAAVWVAVWFPDEGRPYWYRMWAYDPADADYRDGAWFTFSRRWLPLGAYGFRFAAQQGASWVYWPAPAGEYRPGPWVSKTIFDDGTWWVRAEPPQASGGGFGLWLGQKYEGRCAILTFGHRIGDAPYWPAVAVLYDSGYIRLKPLPTAQEMAAGHDLPFGSSFVLGPGYWGYAASPPTYYHNPRLTRVTLTPLGDMMSLAVDAVTSHFNVQYSIGLSEPTSAATEMIVGQTARCLRAFALPLERVQQHEAFKVAQISSMYEGTLYHDSDTARYLAAGGAEIGSPFAALGCGSLVFPQPAPMGPSSEWPHWSWLEATHSDAAGWQGPTPSCRITLATGRPQDHTPQGWIACSSDPNDDNVGLWIAQDNLPLSWVAGDTHRVDYLLTSRPAG